MERYVLNNLLADIPFEKVLEQLKLSEDVDTDDFQVLFKEAMVISRPKAVYKVCYLDGIDGDLVTVDGIAFQSSVLAENLDGLHRIFAYVMTCGTEIDELAKRQDDYILSVWMDMLKGIILQEARVLFLDHIKQTYGFPVVSSMNPGSGNLETWPLAQQAELFQLIGGVHDDIGVTLNKNMLMDPNKSVSGILFQSDKEYIACALCRRENCQGRRAPYSPQVNTPP